MPGLTSLLLLLSSAHAANGDRTLWTIVRSGQDRKAEEPTEGQSNEAASVPEVEAGASNAAEAIIEATTL